MKPTVQGLTRGVLLALLFVPAVLRANAQRPEELPIPADLPSVDEASAAVFEEAALLDRIHEAIGTDPSDKAFDWVGVAPGILSRLGMNPAAADDLHRRIEEENENQRQVEVLSARVLSESFAAHDPTDPVTGDFIWPTDGWEFVE